VRRLRYLQERESRPHRRRHCPHDDPLPGPSHHRGSLEGPWRPDERARDRQDRGARADGRSGLVRRLDDYSGLSIGVLALQGAFIEHVKALRALGAQAREVRLPSDLDGLDGLILPGGESTSIGKLLVEYDLLKPVRAWAEAGRPLYGTCAGAILLARDIGGLDQPLIGVLDIEVERNAFGRQLQSFETDLEVPRLGPKPFHAIFIRSPGINSVGPDVGALSCLPAGTIAAARLGPLLVTWFH